MYKNNAQYLSTADFFINRKMHIVFIWKYYYQIFKPSVKSIKNNVAVVIVNNKIMLYYNESSIYSGGTVIYLVPKSTVFTWRRVQFIPEI